MFCCSVIIEIEIGNRSINMRQEFLPYFTDPTLLAVVGVSFFGSGRNTIGSVHVICSSYCICVHFCFLSLCSDVCPAQRAVAVKWVLTNRGIEVAVVMDFGVDPISTNAMQVFAQDVAGVADEMLPGVRPDLWAHNRHVPLTVAAFDPAPEALTPDLCAQYIYNQNNDRNLYATSTVPIITFPGSELQSVLHNLPDEAEALDDFNLNLANVFFWVMKGAEYTE